MLNVEDLKRDILEGPKRSKDILKGLGFVNETFIRGAAVAQSRCFVEELNVSSICID